MRTRAMVATAAVAMVLVALPAFANGPGGGAGNECSPNGTWFGSNGLGQDYLFTITRVGGGRYTAVSDGLTVPDFCSENTAFRGDLVRTGPDTFELRQILICDSYGTLLLWASSGEVVFTDCDHFDALFDNIGAYFWAPGITPFVDPFDVPLIPPGDPLPASYDRMPAP
jgi:hypothetical protein